MQLDTKLHSKRFFIKSVLLSSVFILAGCSNPNDPSNGAYKGSHDPIPVPENPNFSDYEPRDPYQGNRSSIFMRNTKVENAEAAGIERWDWMVGPNQTSSDVSFKHPVYLTTISGKGEIILSQGENTQSSRISGNASMFVSPDTKILIVNGGDQPILIRALYMVAMADRGK